MNIYSRRRWSLGPFISLLVFVVIIGGVGFFVYHLFASETVAMQGHPVVAVEGCSTVKVAGTSRGNDVIIQIFQGSHSDYEREMDGNVLYLKGNACFEMDLQVPQHTDLRIIATSDIEVSGVTGEMQLKGGTISIMQSALQAKSTLESSDDIRFYGTLDKKAQVVIKANNSILDIELTKDIAFNLDLTGSIGSFNTTFPGIQLTMNSSSGINDVHTLIGSDPQARLSIIGGDSTSVLLTRV